MLWGLCPLFPIKPNKQPKQRWRWKRRRSDSDLRRGE
jgi:hypothetical protein